jgi:hypothetical protein
MSYAEKRQAARRAEHEKQTAAGRHYTARCNCYAGHASNSGRCTDRGPTSDGFYGDDPAPVCNSCTHQCR